MFEKKQLHVRAEFIIVNLKGNNSTKSGREKENISTKSGRISISELVL